MSGRPIRHTEPCGCSYVQVTTPGDEYQGQSWQQVIWCPEHPPQRVSVEAVRQRAQRARDWCVAALLEGFSPDRQDTSQTRIHFDLDMPALLDEVERLREENATQDRTIARLQAELLGGETS